jgi:hypothetical protein
MKEEEPKTPEISKLLNEKKQALIKELNSYVALRKTYSSSMGNRQELLDGGSFGGSAAFDNTRLASTMSNQELVQVGRKQMDQTDQTIERSKKVCEIPSSPPLHQLSSVLVWKGFGCLEWFAWDFLPLVQLLHELPWTMSLTMHRCLRAINRFMSLFEQVVEDTINIGAETASTLKGQVRGFPCPIEVQATMCTASIHGSNQILYRD